MADPTPPVMPPNKIAFVIDGKVQDVFHTDDRLAAILLSSPTIINATSYYANQADGFNIVDWDYDGANFTAPVVVQAVDAAVPPININDPAVQAAARAAADAYLAANPAPATPTV